MNAIVCFTRCYACQFDYHFDPPQAHTWMDKEDAEHAGHPWPLPAEIAATNLCACPCAKETPVRRPRITRLPLWVWAAWLALTLGSFAVLETIGLVTNAEGDTLSEATRRWLGIEPVAPWRIAGMVTFSVALLGFVAWFLPHVLFKFGWWTRRPNTDKETK